MKEENMLLVVRVKGADLTGAQDAVDVIRHFGDGSKVSLSWETTDEAEISSEAADTFVAADATVRNYVIKKFAEIYAR